MCTLSENILLKVCSKIMDPVTTTDELIPSGETSSYRSNPLGLAEFTLSRRDPDYVGRSKAVDRLEKAVLTFLQTMVAVSVEYESLVEKIRHSAQRKTESTHLQKTLQQQCSEREKCHRMMVGLYPDLKTGLISQEEYLILKADLQTKLDALDTSIAKLRQTAEQYAGNLERENEFLSHFRKYHNFSQLTRPMLTELVSEIRIYEGGRLEIVLNFQDELKALTDYLELNKEALEEKACAM